ALRGAGHRVELAIAGDKALAAATAAPYDAIVLDRGLPGLDGLEVCRRLRAAGNSVPILMLTARAAVSERVEGLDAGADDYVVKPFALDELLARLRAFERRSPPVGQAGAAILMYFIVETQLVTQFNNSLVEAAGNVRTPPRAGDPRRGGFPGGPSNSLTGLPDVAAQIINSTNGTVARAGEQPIIALVTS